MVKPFLNYKIVLIALSIMLVSCTKDLDFNQVGDFEISPVFESSLIFFDAPATRFFVEGNEVDVVRDSVLIDFFNKKFVVENLVKSEFFFEVTNSINRAFNVQVGFLNNANQLKYTFSIFVPASPSNEEIITNHTEVFEGNSLNALKGSSKIVLDIQVLNGPPINENTLGNIKLRSKGLFYLLLDDTL
jgi:hypothetical protein